MGKHRCGTCRFFQEANLAGSGWCHHPQRKTTSDLMLMVRKNELACRDAWSHDLWEAATGAGGAKAEPRGTIEPFPSRKLPPATAGEIAAVVQTGLRLGALEPAPVKEDVVLSELAPGPEPEPDWSAGREEPAPAREANTRTAIIKAREAYRERNRTATARTSELPIEPSPTAALPPMIDDDLPDALGGGASRAIAPTPQSGRVQPAVDLPWAAPPTSRHHSADPDDRFESIPEPLAEFSLPRRADQDAPQPASAGAGPPEPAAGRRPRRPEFVGQRFRRDASAAVAPTYQTGRGSSELDWYNHDETADPITTTGRWDPDSASSPRGPSRTEPAWPATDAVDANADGDHAEFATDFQESTSGSTTTPSTAADVDEEPAIAETGVDKVVLPAESELDDEIDTGVRVAAHLPRICRTCRDYRPAETGERGWCANEWAFTHRRMVDANEQAPCEGTLGSWWLPVDEVWSAAADVSSHGQPTPLLDKRLPHHRDRVAQRRQS